MRAVDIIRAKRDGETLGRPAIDAFVAGTLDGAWADYQIAAMLMAIVLRGMTAEETAWLTDAMVRSGRRVDLSGLGRPTVGKHSTGGVGDKVSIVLAPTVAACGAIMPKMSGRGLGHTGGTLDKLESIPGFRIALSPEAFVAVLRDVGCAIVGQTADIAPADKVLYALRDVTATIESVPLISASVMSKKLAEGSQALVLDVKCGRGAFMKTLPQALELARSLVAIGTANGVRTEAFVTGMDGPLGRAVGNALEIAECIEVLAGGGPPDLRALVETLAARAVELGGCAATPAEALAKVRGVLDGGQALSTLRAMIAAQGGDAAVVDDPGRLPRASHVEPLEAAAAGTVASIDAELIGRATVLLGAGRARAGDPVDHAAGIRLRVGPGDEVARGAPLLELHYNDAAALDDARALARQAFAFGVPPPAAPLVKAWVHRDGETVHG
jgi:pyrimidine-nucleoside phosphorylase